MTYGPWYGFAVALGIGLLIGLEREHAKGTGPQRRPAGIRTFALASLLGAVALRVGGVALLGVATGGVALIVGWSVARDRGDDPGLTTEVGLVMTPLVGAAALTDAPLAAGLGAVIAALFAVKAPLHAFVRRKLSDAELRDGLVLAVATLVVWPLLPNRYLGPLQAINPHALWLLVVLMLALGAAGQVASRALGPAAGLPVTGLAAGFVSSAATMASMGGEVVRAPACLRAAVAGATLSTMATFLQMGVVLATVARPTLRLMLPSLAAGAVVASLYGLFYAWRAAGGTTTADPPAGQAFTAGTALRLAGLMAVMLIAAAVIRRWLGESGVIAAAVVAGFVDTHAAALSIASLGVSAGAPPAAAVVPILAAMTSNAVAKLVIAFGSGPRAYALRVAPGVVLSMAGAWVVALLPVAV